MNKEYFHQRIKETLDLCAYEFYVVHPDSDIRCTCVTHATQEGDPACVMCLGMGYRIRIKKVRGASNDYTDNVAGRGVKGAMGEAVLRTYFVDERYHIKEDDLIIDNDRVYYAYRVDEMRGFDGEQTHQQIRAIPHRNNTSIIQKNFKRIMERHKGGSK